MTSSLDQDRQQLRLLSVFHYVVGALTLLFACFPFIHVGIGIAMLTGAFDDSSQGTPPPPFVGWLFVGVGSFIILLGWTLGVLIILAGRKLSKLTSYQFCFVIACVECLFMPFGTVLGVFTIIVLSRPTVKALFEANK